MRTLEEANPSAPCIYLHSQVYIHHLIPKLQENKNKKNSSSRKLSVSFFMERPLKAQYFRICFCFRRMFRLKAAEPPQDVKALFETYSENGTMSVDHLLWFLLEFQGEEKATKEDAQAILNSLKHLNIFQRKGLHLEAFFKHLFSDNNPPLSPLGVHHDMTAPLAHYFLYTSHNSYLTGNQLSSDCSDEPIIKALKRGVRVIELDLWPNSTRDGVDVRHGGTLTTPIELGKCLCAIKDNAFVASEYPVIITFEDHLTPVLQAKVAHMVIETFGSTLFRPESELKELPSPQSLKSKILISTKPPKEYLEAHVKQKGNPHKAKGSAVDDEIEVDDEDHESDEEEDVQAEYRSLIAIHAGKVKGGMHNWFSDDPDKVRRVSLSEQELENAVRTDATDIVRFTRRNLLRVYPKGIRFDSSNYNPFVGWAHGAQMVAYNMQGYGKNLWIMHGMFRANGGCGYVKKPDFLLDRYENFHPEEDELPVKTTLKVKIYFGEGWQSDFSRTYFDLYSPPDFYTKVGIAGVQRDTKMHRTKAIEDQWVPVWNEEFEFPLTVPELAVLRIEVMEYDTSGKPDFGGQTCLPISELRSGIRAVPLHDRRGDKYKSVKLLMQFKFV